MNSIKNKRILIAVGILLFLIVVAAIGSLSYIRKQNSPEHQAELLSQAIEKKDYPAFRKICPTFSNGTKINKEAFQTFAENFSGKKKSQQIRKKVENKQLFTVRKAKSQFKPATFRVQASYIKLEKNKNTAIIASIGNHLLTENKNKLGPLIADSYQVNYSIENPIYGKTSSVQKENLMGSEPTFSVDEKALFSKADSFQKKLLQQVVSYYVAVNQGIENDLNFSKVEGTTQQTKEYLQSSYDQARPYLKSVNQKFQTFIMNVESLNLEGVNEPKAVFDIYSDVSLELDVKVSSKKAEKISSVSKNGTVTVQYDDQAKQWLIDKIDFETFEQDPSEWESKRQIKLPQVNQASWNEEGKSSADL